MTSSCPAGSVKAGCHDFQCQVVRWYEYFNSVGKDERLQGVVGGLAENPVRSELNSGGTESACFDPVTHHNNTTICVIDDPVQSLTQHNI